MNDKNTVDGIIKGFSQIVDKLNSLSKTQDGWNKTSQFSTQKDDLKGVFGFSVKVGLGGDKPSVEPFGNIKTDKKTGKSVVQEVREPIADIFEEKDYTQVVLEMPGISESDIQLDITDDLMVIAAHNGKKKYQKEVLLPRACKREDMTLSCNNGILEIRCGH